MINKLTYANQLYSKTPHTLLVGSSGYGKDVAGEGYITKYIGDYKVFDMNSENRGEGMYYGIKQDDLNMINKLNYLSNGILKPQAYNSEIIMFLGNNLKKIKQLPKNIKVCVFNEEWITNEELKSFIAFNESQISLMDTIFEIKEDKHITLTKFYEFLMKASREHSWEKTQLKQYGAHYMTINTLKRRCRSLLRSGLFHNDEDDIGTYFEYLDLEKSARDKNTITSYNRWLIDSDYASYVCMNVLFKKFIEFIELREIDIPLLLYVREMYDFYYMKDPPQYILGIRDYINKILRRGRFLGKAKIMFVGNTQSPSHLPLGIFTAFNKFYVFHLPLNESKRLLNKATIPIHYLIQLSQLDVGVSMVVMGGGFEYPIRVPPTLHKKSEPNFDVFEYLGSKYKFKSYINSNFCQIN